jgi:DNA polymerase-3 subunit beta
MKIEKGQLVKHLSRVDKVVLAKSTNPILENIKIESKKDSGIIIYATDFETSIQEKMLYDVDEDFIFAVNGKKFFNIVKSFPAGMIDIDVKGSVLFMRQNKILFKINTQDHEDYPDLSFYDTSDGFIISGKDLLTTIDKVIHATAKGVKAYVSSVMDGVMFRGIDNKFIGAATDGYRIAYIEKEIVNLADFPAIVIPKGSLAKLKGIFEVDDNIMVVTKGNNIQLSTIHSTLLSRTTEKAFPDIDRFAKLKNPNIAYVDRIEFIKVLKNVTSLLDDYETVRLSFSDNTLTMDTESLHGQATAEMDIKYEGEAMAKKYNVNFLMDAVSRIESYMFIMALPEKDISNPTSLRGTGEDGYINLVMPVAEDIE